MATFTAINCKHQSGGAMRGTLDYVSQKKKTLWGDAQLVVGHNCVPQSAYTEMLGTYRLEVAVVRQLDDGSVDTVFSDTEQTDPTWDRQMLIEGRVFRVTSVFAGEPSATPTEKLLALIDTELAKGSHSA